MEMASGHDLYFCILLLGFFPFAQEEEELAGVDSELDDSGSEVDEEEIVEQITELPLELRGKVMEKECPPCKDSATPLLASGNKGNQQPSACSCEEVLYTSHFTGNQTSTRTEAVQSKLIESKNSAT